MWFWIKHLSLAAGLIILAVYFLLGDGPVFDFKESNNAAAQGLSRFYSSIRNKVSSEQGKFVLQLKKPEQTLERVLAERMRIIEPIPKTWTGKIEPRRFENGSTLKKALSQYASNEGIELYWYLSKDYVVKDHFRVDSNFTSTLYQVGRAINDDFENEVYTYLCHKQRAAVITELPSEFVRTNCLQLKT
ncbi:hypothetical protein PNIG_a3305 [Pseudoalteromonas nigrifaciens]|uniref:Toxin co-regulated pilus biosynthesis protein Q C-terminal domain-containing protein n=1 Tax=Pseudoalteromonas nigrifaciens TaxID=28109 RepID=A0AAC9ULY1_9GAMM|nr:toxin co-regulated pilus biosynthesis Q family protein [Pseudoalteromonas nigrifaciens]ASM55211.1 hypothetical protein PNIG_a3305 [Pseudoalteromonas nigrifaciens]GEN42311.1 hypothetical protein PNI02_17770 [Pseudoalteromonas nigrifaciens]SUC50985.1 Toxin co-regulated pilus biosynthesis protein Q [Pseudoalteromonas nigrifaciens]